MYTRQDLTKYLGKRIQFRVNGSPITYRGCLTACYDDYFVFTGPFIHNTTCEYVDIAKGSLIALVNV